MTDALQGVAVADLPGNYRFHDPANFELAGAPPPQQLPSAAVASIGEDGQPIMLAPRQDEDARAAPGPIADALDQGWFDGPQPNEPPEFGEGSAGPVPPGDVGGGAPPPRRRGGFFQRLFGG